MDGRLKSYSRGREHNWRKPPDFGLQLLSIITETAAGVGGIPRERSDPSRRRREEVVDCLPTQTQLSKTESSALKYLDRCENSV